MDAGRPVNILTHQSTEHEHDANDDERLDGGEPIRLGDIVSDAVKDVDQTEEDRDKNCHPARDALGRDKEGDPGDYDEHAGGEVVCDNVESHLPPKC